MTRSGPGPDPGDGSGAAATVVGAILVVSLLVVGLIVFRTSFVPTWEEEAEQRFMDGVAEDLLRLRGHLDSHLSPGDSGRLTATIPTSQGGATPSAPPREDNLLGFRPDTRRVTVHAPDATVWERNGTLLVREDPDWRDVPGADLTVDAIDEVLDLRVRFASVSADDDGESFTVRAIGPGLGLEGLITYTIEDTRGAAGGPDRSQIVAEVENADGETVFDQAVATFTAPQTDYEVDVLDPLPGFDQILASTPKPLRLVLVENGVDAERALTHRARNATSGVSVVLPGGGAAEDPLRESFAGGHLRYEARNNFYVDQVFEVGHGAMVLHQDDAAVVRAGPHGPVGRVSQGLADERVALGVSIPSLTGPSRTVSGAGAVSVATDARSKTAVRAVAPSASVNLTTDVPAAWTQWIRGHLEDADLSEAAGEFDVRTGSDFVNVTVEGPSTDPGVDDVHLDLRQANVRTVLER